MPEDTAEWSCETCGWIWPLPGDPPAGAECDNCGDELTTTEIDDA